MWLLHTGSLAQTRSGFRLSPERRLCRGLLGGTWEVTLTSDLSRRWRGGGSHPHLRPLPSMEMRGSTLTSVLSRRWRGGGSPPHLSPLPSMEMRREHPHLSALPAMERRGQSPSQCSPSMERREPAPSRIILPALQAYFEWRLHYVRQATDGLWLQPADG